MAFWQSDSTKGLFPSQRLQQKVILPFVDLLLYGNFWIALAALFLTWQTQFLLFGALDPGAPIAWFNFGGTLFLYALHRLIGMEKVKAFADRGRYLVIARFQRHIQIYSVLGAILATYMFLQLQAPTRYVVVVPALLSLGYVVPFLAGGRRLRDLHYLKIFLVAIVWSWLTIIVPAWEWGLGGSIPVWVLFLERCFFVFAITLPFDIRDLEVDQHTSVQTIPAHMGIPKTRRLSFWLLGLSFLMALLNLYLQLYSIPLLLGVISYLIVTGILILGARPGRHDYYYSGLIDGVMILQGVLLWIFAYWSS